MGGKLPPFAIADTDGTPTIWQPSQIYFPNGTVTDIGNGNVFVNTGPSGSGTTLSAATPVLIVANTIQVGTSGATVSTFWRGDFTWREVVEARTPLLKAGSILSLNTDGNTANFLRGDGIFTAPPSGIAYAPSGATYIIQTNNSILPNAQILASLSSGLFKNTAVTGVLVIATSGTDYYNLPAQVDHNQLLNYATNRHFLQTSITNVDSSLATGLLKTTTTTGVLSIGSGGVDFENIVSVNSPLLRSVNILSINTASGTVNGFLLSGDWTTFNGKESVITFNSPLSRSVNNVSLLSSLVVDTLQSTRIVSGTASSTYPLHIEGSGFFTNTLRINNYILPTSAGAAGQQIVLAAGSNFIFANTGGGSGEVVEARSPLLKAGTVMSLQTDGTVTNYLRGDGTYRSIYEARSPFLASGTILSILTDGITTNFLRGDGTYAAPPSGLVYAPTGATYILQTNNAILSSAQVLAALSTGLVKSTSGTGVLSIAIEGTDYERVLEARSPLLKAGTILSLNTDGATITYLRGDGSYRSVYEARSPLLSAGTILSILTDGTTTNFLRGDGIYAVPASNSGIKCSMFSIGSDDSWNGEEVPIFQAPYDTPITLKRLVASIIGTTTCQLIFNLDMRVSTSLNAIGITKVFATNQSAVTQGFSTTSF